MKLVDTKTVQTGGRVALSKDMLEDLGWEKGALISVFISDNKKAVILKRLEGDEGKVE